MWFKKKTQATQQLQPHPAEAAYAASIAERERLGAENAKLKADVRQLSTILNMLPYPVWQRGDTLNIRYYNLAYGEITENESDADESLEVDRKARALAQAALDTQQKAIERRHIVAGGERRYYEFQELPVTNEKMLVGCAIDIDEVEALQEELQRYVSAQSDLLESSASAMAIFAPDMRLTSFNYAYVGLWKLDESWLDTGPTYSEILENLREKRRLPEQANFLMFKQQQLKLFTGLIEPREEFFYLPDGKVLRVIAIPHALGGILFTYEDVTDRLALERSYNTLIAVQRETLDNLHEGVAVFSEDGRLRLSNPVYLRMWNIDPDFAKQEPHISTLVEHAKELFIFENWEEYKRERIAQIQSRTHRLQRIERRDGMVIDCATVPLPDGATLINYMDMTDSTLLERSLRERNEALQEADRLKTEFLANVSYELRSPLTSITGFSEMLKNEYFGNLSDKQKEYVEGIHHSSQYLMQLVNDILDLASIEAGYMQLNLSSFDIGKMAKSVMSLVQERAREHSLEIKLECPARIGKMRADETRIKQILFNLLSNAIKFSPNAGQITLGVNAAEEEVRFFVQDQGSGIPKEEREHIFDTFYKGANRSIPKAKARAGTGLGLSLVKNFIDLHGGRVELESEEGKGTRITCVVPRAGAEKGAEKSAQMAKQAVA